MLWYVIFLLPFKEVKKKNEEINMNFKLRMKSPTRLIGSLASMKKQFLIMKNIK